MRSNAPLFIRTIPAGPVLRPVRDGAVQTGPAPVGGPDPAGARPARLQLVRVRQFELRLLAVALTILWTAGGGLVLVAYRPGGPVDVLVGVAASLPLIVSVASIIWPPLVRSDRGATGVFWLGLAAGLLLLPSIASVGTQIVQGGSEPLLPSFEVIYPWALALVATSLFAGLGVSRQVISEVGFGRRRLVVSVAFAVVATSIIGGIFAGVSLADDYALRDRPAAHSRFGPTNPNLTPPDCRATLVRPTSAQLQVDFSANVDGRAVGTVGLSGARSGADISWTAQVVKADLYGDIGAVRIGSAGWTLAPGGKWTLVAPELIDGQMVDLTVLQEALSADNRATAEDHGLEYVEGARARHCRIAVDGNTYLASFPQVKWLLGPVNLETWRGELDFWIFGDGEVGMVSGTVNGTAQEVHPHGLLSPAWVKLTATDRDATVLISPPAP